MEEKQNIKQWWEVGWESPIPERKSYGPGRFWVKVGEPKEIIFVDEDPIRFFEHNYRTEERGWRNYVVCLQGITKEPCPLCQAGVRSYYVGMFTVVDLSEWVDSAGNKHKNEIRLFAAKSDVLKTLKIRKEKYGLAGVRYTVNRLKSNSPSTGDDFLYEGKIPSWKDYGFETPPAPLDYKALFKPLSLEEMREIAVRITLRTKSEEQNDDDESVSYY